MLVMLMLGNDVFQRCFSQGELVPQSATEVQLVQVWSRPSRPHLICRLTVRVFSLSNWWSEAEDLCRRLLFFATFSRTILRKIERFQAPNSQLKRIFLKSLAHFPEIVRLDCLQCALAAKVLIGKDFVWTFLLLLFFPHEALPKRVLVWKERAPGGGAFPGWRPVARCGCGCFDCCCCCCCCK